MAPAWALALIREVCEEAGAPFPILHWRRSSRSHSSGVSRRGEGTIAVTAGSDEIDQRVTLLHELAHWIGPMPRRSRRRVVHHDARFYATAFGLYRRHGLADGEALVRESWHYPSSLRFARRLGIEGAEEAWAARRATLRERARIRRPMRVLVPEHTVRLVRDGRWTRCATCGVRVVGPILASLRRRSGRHELLGT